MNAKVVVGSAACLAVAVAVWITGSGQPLWALILVGMMMEAKWE